MVDVAERAGVSIATVSRALRDVPGVSPRTRARVRQVAEDLSYVVSPEASGLAQGRTGRVAVVVPRADVWFYSAMLAGIEPLLSAADLDLVLYQVDGAEERRRFFRELPARRKVDAVVLVALPLLPDEEARLSLLGAQLVVAGGRVGDHPRVQVDEAEVARLAVEHLVGLGHRDLAMVRTDDTAGAVWTADLGRMHGFEQLVARRGDVEGSVVTVPVGAHAGRDAVRALLDLPVRPTGVFAYSDEIALDLVEQLRRAGVDVPGEVSVVGVDDHPLAGALGLTTVDQRVAEQARLAGELVLDVLAAAEAGESLPADPAPRRPTPRLLVRASTAPAPG